MFIKQHNSSYFDMSIKEIIDDISSNDMYKTFEKKAELCKMMYLKNAYRMSTNNFSLFLNHLILKIVLIVDAMVLVLSPFFLLDIDVSCEFLMSLFLIVITYNIYDGAKLKSFFYTKQDYLRNKELIDVRLDDLGILYAILLEGRYPTSEEMNYFASDSLKQNLRIERRIDRL